MNYILYMSIKNNGTRHVTWPEKKDKRGSQIELYCKSIDEAKFYAFDALDFFDAFGNNRAKIIQQIQQHKFPNNYSDDCCNITIYERED